MQDSLGNRANTMLGNRLRKTLYYGKFSDASLPSFPMNDVAVDILNASTPLSPKKLEHNFASKVARKVRISPCALMMGIIYSERLCRRNPNALQKMSSSDLFLISVMVASKYLYDEGEEEEVFNDEWATAASYSANEVNRLEMEFLAALDWSLFVDGEEFFDFMNRIESSIAVRQGLLRGWFSYTDIRTLLGNSHYQETLTALAQEFIKMVLVSSLIYSLGIASLLGTAAVIHTARIHHPAINTSCESNFRPCTFSNLNCRHEPAVLHSCHHHFNNCNTRKRIPFNASFTEIYNHKTTTSFDKPENNPALNWNDINKDGQFDFLHSGRRNSTFFPTSDQTWFSRGIFTDDTKSLKRKEFPRLCQVEILGFVNRFLTFYDS